MHVFVLTSWYYSFQTNIAPSPVPLAPQHPVDEDEDSNTSVVIGFETGEEMESEVAPPPVTSESRSKSNQDRDAAREGATRGTKRAISPSRVESRSKLPALSLSHGKVARMKPKKVLSTLGGRKVSASTDVPKAHKKYSESGSAQAAPSAVAPPRRAGHGDRSQVIFVSLCFFHFLLILVVLICLRIVEFIRVVPSRSMVSRLLMQPLIRI